MIPNFIFMLLLILFVSWLLLLDLFQKSRASSHWTFWFADDMLYLFYDLKTHLFSLNTRMNEITKFYKSNYRRGFDK